MRHFDVVAFAVLEDPGYGPGGNLRAFEDAFSRLPASRDAPALVAAVERLLAKP
jgi:hypothetical protein